MFKKYLNNSHGVTLIEVLIVIIIIGVVAAVGSNFLNFGLDSFQISNNQFNAQSPVRIAAELIENEVQFSTNVEILSSVPEPIPLTEKDTILYFNFDDNNMYISEYTSDTTARSVFVLDGNFENTSAFSTIAGSETLIINIDSKEKQEVYNINKKIEIVNLRLQNKLIGGSVASGPAISFNSEFSFDDLGPGGGSGDPEGENPEIFYDVTFLYSADKFKASITNTATSITQSKTAGQNEFVIVFSDNPNGTYNFELKKQNNQLIDSGSFIINNGDVTVDRQ